MTFEKEIEDYENIRMEYQQKVANRMSEQQWMEYNEVLFSAHSCAIEGNSFTVDDTRILHVSSFSKLPLSG
jgi:hypothetical protein